MDSPNKRLHRLLGSATACLLAGFIQSTAEARTIDGFFMYCTSNLDGPGSCTNEEDNRAFTCMVVAGQIITCPGKQAATVDCVWISSISENQAQFWCDTEDERAMYSNSNPSSPAKESGGNDREPTSKGNDFEAEEPDTFNQVF
jgi:hypothetical protein